MPCKYALEVSYDGTDFCGWQSQQGANPKLSIEESLALAIETLVGESPTLVASGRTDAGVHACGQVAHFYLQEAFSSDENFLKGLNAILPDTIQVQKLGMVADSFRANHASEKQYSYYFQIGPSHLPHLKRYAMWDYYKLDGELMSEAVQHLIGEHDFQSFCSANANVASTVRTIFSAEISRQEISNPGCFSSELHHLLRFRIRGNGFLKQMVRCLAGTLKQIGEARRSPCDMVDLLNNPLRNQAGPTAPANGLWLDRVWYSKQVGIDFLHQGK